MSSSGGKVQSNTIFNRILAVPSTVYTITGQTANLDTSSSSNVLILINISAVSGTTPTLTFNWYHVGFDSVLFPVLTSSAFTAVGQYIASLGPGTANNFVINNTSLLNYIIGGTTPSFTFSINILGR